MTSAERKLLLPFVRDVLALCYPLRREARKLLERFDRKPSLKKRAIKKERKAKKLLERQVSGRAISALRVAVFLRAGNRCEYIYLPSEQEARPRCAYDATVLDHWLSGNGRRRQKQAIENCWALCQYHNGLRTDLNGGIEWWNKAFARHAAAYGYPPLPHVEHAALARPDTRRSLKGLSP